MVGEQQLIHMLFGGQETKSQDHQDYLMKDLDNIYTCNFIDLDQQISSQRCIEYQEWPMKSRTETKSH